MAAATAPAAVDSNDRVLLSFGLVADNHYDTFPAGEKAPWETLQHWFQGQVHRTTTTKKRRYDVAKDKMDEAIGVFNRYQHPSHVSSSASLATADNNADGSLTSASPPPAVEGGLDLVVNLGDLVNNDLMWNLKPILDSFNRATAPHFHLIGNHDLRAHNDRFGKMNATQHRWIQEKLGLSKEWYYTLQHPPFLLLFLDSMVLEPESKNLTKKREHMSWIDEQLATSEQRGEIVVLFAHIPIGFQTNVLAPILKKYNHIALAFFGHDHRGGYLVQGVTHCVTVQGQIETLTNAFALVEVFADRTELTGYGRVPSRILLFPPEIRQRMDRYLAKRVTPTPGMLRMQGNQPAPPEQLWEKEVLQEPPLLLLNIPTYRKPNVPAAKPNESSTTLTRYMRALRSLSPPPPKTLSPEAPVDLTSALATGKRGDHKASVLVNNEVVLVEPGQVDAVLKSAATASREHVDQEGNRRPFTGSGASVRTAAEKNAEEEDDDSFLDVEEIEDRMERLHDRKSLENQPDDDERYQGGGRRGGGGAAAMVPLQGWLYHTIVMGPLVLTSMLATVVCIRRRGGGAKRSTVPASSA